MAAGRGSGSNGALTRAPRRHLASHRSSSRKPCSAQACFSSTPENAPAASAVPAARSISRPRHCLSSPRRGPSALAWTTRVARTPLLRRCGRTTPGAPPAASLLPRLYAHFCRADEAARRHRPLVSDCYVRIGSRAGNLPQAASRRRMRSPAGPPLPHPPALPTAHRKGCSAVRVCARVARRSCC